MSKPSQGRVLELTTSTRDQRKAISRVISAIKAATAKSFDDIYTAAHGSLEGRADEDERNLPKGKIAHTKIAPIHRWIIDHYLPLACAIAPEIFDPSLLTRWRDFVRDHGRYEFLKFQFTGDMGLTERSISQPIEDIPIGSGQKFVFDLETNITGKLLTLESAGEHTYPFSVHPDHCSVTLDVNAKSKFLPLATDGSPSPLSDTANTGLRCYVFIIAEPDIIDACAKGLVQGHPIGLDKLDQIALAFKDVDPTKFEVHRLNVVFSG